MLGQPGIGKSTLITYFLKKSEDRRKKRVFRIADFSNCDECKKWRSEKRYAADWLLKALGLSKQDLNQSVLFLDGLDEINLVEDERIEFINESE